MRALPPQDPAEAFARLIYARHRGSLLNYLRSLGVQARDREDVLQEVIRRACEARETYDPAQSLGAWLFGIARNVTRNHLRRMHHRCEVLIASEQGSAIEAAPDAGPDPEAVLIRRDRLGMLEEMVGSLKREEQREALVQHKLEEAPLDEMARARGVNPKTMWSRCKAAFDECVGWFQRWRATERFKGRDGVPVVLLPLLEAERAARSTATRDALRRYRGPVVARGGVALVGLSCMSAPLIAQETSEAPAIAAAVIVAVPLPATSSGPPAARPAASGGAATEAQARDAQGRATRMGSAPRAQERRGHGDDLESRWMILRAEAEQHAGNLDEAGRVLLEHAERFPDGAEAARRNRMLRGLGGR